MIAHGLNNMYENGYYLLFREEQSGTLRDAYRFAATKLGYGNNRADLVYGVVDLSLSAYGAGRKVLGPREKSRVYSTISNPIISEVGKKRLKPQWRWI